MTRNLTAQRLTLMASQKLVYMQLAGFFGLDNAACNFRLI